MDAAGSLHGLWGGGDGGGGKGGGEGGGDGGGGEGGGGASGGGSGGDSGEGGDSGSSPDPNSSPSCILRRRSHHGASCPLCTRLPAHAPLALARSPLGRVALAGAR